MAQELVMDSAKETHSFSGMFSCNTSPGVIILFEHAAESEETGYFWKLEQVSRNRSFFMPEGSRKTFGRITKVFINESSCTKVSTPWGVARSTIDEMYGRLYWAHFPSALVASSHYHYLPMEEIEELVVIAFVLRYSEDVLEDAPLRLNINVRGNELPGASHDDIVINVRTGNKVISNACCEHHEHKEKYIGGIAVLTKNPARKQIHEVDEDFIKYLLQQFGNGCLKLLLNYNKHHACVFCNYFDIKEPFGGSCCTLM